MIRKAKGNTPSEFMLLNNTKIRLFTAFLAVLMLLPSCAMNMAKDKLPINTGSTEVGVYEGDAYGKLELPVIIKRPSKQEENKNDVTVDVSRPGVGSSGATNEKVFVPYDVPLSIEQQKIVEKIAERFYISEELIFGVMKVESKYNVYAIGKNGNYLGIMQIAKSNLKILKQYCGVTDLMDFEQNVIAGSYYLRTYLTRYNDDKHISLLYYHGGYKYANKLIANGQYEDAYTRAVIKEMNRIVEARRKLANEMGVKLYGGFYEDYT